MQTRADDGEIRDDAAASPAAAPAPVAIAPVAAAPVDAAAIDYSRTQFNVTRRQWRLLVALTLFNTMALGWFAFAPNSSAYIKTQWQQWQVKRAETARLRQLAADQQTCLDYVMPPERLIYEEDPAAALKLTTAKAGYVPVRVQV